MTPDHARQLDELMHLHEQGILDDEAYQAARVKLADTVLAETTASVSPKPDPRTPASAAVAPGARAQIGKKSEPRRGLLGCLLMFGLFILSGWLIGLVSPKTNPGSQSGGATTAVSGRATTAAVSESRSGAHSATDVPSASVSASPVPTKSSEELLKIVDEYWAKSDWDAIVSLLTNDPVARDNSTLQEKLYAALINQGQTRAAANNAAGAAASYRRAISLDSARGIAQSKLADLDAQSDKSTAEAVKKQMKQYSGDGAAVVAVSDVIAQGYFNTGYSTYHPKRPDQDQYLLISVSVLNSSRREISTNPHYFTLLVEGYTMNPETEMYSMSNYFDATDLQPNSYTGGWLLFLAPKAASYTLVYHGLFDSVVRKEIVVTQRK